MIMCVSHKALRREHSLASHSFSKLDVSVYVVQKEPYICFASVCFYFLHFAFISFPVCTVNRYLASKTKEKMT